MGKVICLNMEEGLKFGLNYEIVRKRQSGKEYA